MAKLVKATAHVEVVVKVQISLDENEARALDALAGYGDNAAIEAFYKGCGTHYMRPYEAGLRSFLKTIREVVAPALNEADKLRRDMKSGS